MVWCNLVKKLGVPALIKRVPALTIENDCGNLQPSHLAEFFKIMLEKFVDTEPFCAEELIPKYIELQSCSVRHNSEEIIPGIVSALQGLGSRAIKVTCVKRSPVTSNWKF